MSRLYCCVALALMGCARGARARLVDDLSGLSFVLKPSPSLRLTVAGAVDGTAADVIFDIAGPLTRVSPSCVPRSAATFGTVKVPKPLGGFEEVPEVKLEGVSFGGIRLRPMTAGLIEDPGCVVVLGNDLLGPYALSVDVATRQMWVQPSRPRARYDRTGVARGDDDVVVLDITKHPRGDWPLLAARVRQGEAVFTGTFLLSSGDDRSGLATSVAGAAGLKPGHELFEGIRLPPGTALPAELNGYRGYWFDSVELAPGVDVRNGALKPLDAEDASGVAGVIGADVWGRFNATFDMKAGVLQLSRPRLAGDEKRAACLRDGKADEQGCYQLHVAAGERLSATATVWRPLPDGARLHLELLSAKGEPIASECQLGFSFSSGERGDSTQHWLPWARLRQVMPDCAEAIGKSHGLRLALFEPGGLPECPGTCVYAQHLRTGQLSCECQAQGAGLNSEAERRLLRLYKQQLDGQRRGTAPSREPNDP